MTWNTCIRQVHRWLSIAFTLAVIVNIAALGATQPPVWVGLLALLPLILLLLTGLYLCRMPSSGAADDPWGCSVRQQR